MNIEWYYIAWPVTILVTFYLTKLKFQGTVNEPEVVTSNGTARDKLIGAVEEEYCPHASVLASLTGKGSACLSYMIAAMESGHVTKLTLHAFLEAINEMYMTDKVINLDQINSFRVALSQCKVPGDCEKVIHDIEHELAMLEFRAIGSTEITVNDQVMESVEQVTTLLRDQNKVSDEGDLKSIYERIVKYDKDMPHTLVGLDMIKSIIEKVLVYIPLDEFAFEINARRFTDNLKHILNLEVSNLSVHQAKVIHGKIMTLNFNLILITAKLNKLSKEDYLTDYEYEIFKDQVITENRNGAIYLRAIQNEAFIRWPKDKLIQLVYRNYCEVDDSMDLIDFADLVVTD